MLFGCNVSYNHVKRALNTAKHWRAEIIIDKVVYLWTLWYKWIFMDSEYNPTKFTILKFFFLFILQLWFILLANFFDSVLLDCNYKKCTNHWIYLFFLGDLFSFSLMGASFVIHGTSNTVNCQIIIQGVSNCKNKRKRFIFSVQSEI